MTSSGFLVTILDRGGLLEKQGQVNIGLFIPSQCLPKDQGLLPPPPFLRAYTFHLSSPPPIGGNLEQPVQLENR